jgi:hypothetical protein
VIPRLKAKELPTCKKCIFIDKDVSCHYSNEKTIQKKETDWCSNGKWIIRYKTGVFTSTITEIQRGRSSREVRKERENESNTND